MGASFIHSGHFYSASSSPLLLGGAPDYNKDTVSEFHAEAHRQLSKGLAQGSYVSARAGVEPTTLRLRVVDLTNVPPRPTHTQAGSHLFPDCIKDSEHKSLCVLGFNK